MSENTRIKCFATPETEDLLNLLSGHLSIHDGIKSDVQPCANARKNGDMNECLDGGSTFLTAIMDSSESRESGLRTLAQCPSRVPTIVLFDQEGYNLWEKQPVGHVGLAVLTGSRAGEFKSLEGLLSIGAKFFRVTSDTPWPVQLSQVVAEDIVEFVRVAS